MPDVPEDCEIVIVAVMEQEKDEGKLELRPKCKWSLGQCGLLD